MYLSPEENKDWQMASMKEEIERLKGVITNLKDEIADRSERLEYLENRNKWLTALESAGVDNWNGYDYAGKFLLNDWEGC